MMQRADMLNTRTKRGFFVYNMKLSQQHSDASVAALVEDFGITLNRLTAKEIANLAPVTSNASEEGRVHQW